MKKETKNIKKINFLKVSWISGISIIFFYILGFIISSLLSKNVAASSIWSIFQSVLLSVLGILFILGFYIIGVRYKSSLLKVTAILFIVFGIVSFLTSIFVISPIALSIQGSVLQIAQEMNINLDSMSDIDQQNLATAIMQDSTFITGLSMILSLLLVYIIVLLILHILFGVGLLKLKKELVHGKVTGILEIVGGATLILLGLGFLVLGVAYIYELIIVYRESKK